MLAFAEHHPLLVLGLLVAFSILTSVARTFLGLLSGKPARQHGRVVVDYVQKHGYQLLNPVLAQKLDASVLDMVKDPSLHDLARATSDITDVGRFDDGSDDWLAFRCELGDRPVTVFNFSQTPPLHSSSGPVPFRVAKIQVDGLPRFSLEPRSAATVVETVVGKLLHQPESTIELDPGQHAPFGSRYRLRGRTAPPSSSSSRPSGYGLSRPSSCPGRSPRMRATWSTTNRRPCGPKRITMPSWPSSSASPRDSCDSEPLHSGSVSPEPP